MIIFLYGQDTYRSKEELRKMIEEMKGLALAGQAWFDFVRIDASDKQINVLQELKQTTDTISMFSTRKMIIIEDIFDLNQDDQEEISELLKKRKIENDKETTLIFWAEEAEAKSDLSKYLKSKAECKEFKLLEGVQLRNWIKEFISERKGKIDSQAIDKIINCVGNDLWRMSNELGKLLSCNQNISTENVDLFIKPEIDLNIFEMVDAIGYKNKAKALKLFNQHLADGADEYYLLSMFVYQVRNLIRVKTAEAIELLGLHPFVAKKTGQQAEQFSFEELKKIYHQLMTIDFESKLGKTNVKIALEKLITDL